MRKRLTWALPLTLPLLVSCFQGGGPGPGPGGAQRGLVYVNPQGDGWRFLRNREASSDTHLVLDLVPPSGEAGGRGVAFELDGAGAGAAWAKVAPADQEFVENGAVYDLGTGVQVLLGHPKGGDLKVAVVQKGKGNAAPYAGSGVLSIALEYDPDSDPMGLVEIPLKVVKAFHLPVTGSKVAIAGQVLVGELRVETHFGDPGVDPHTVRVKTP